MSGKIRHSKVLIHNLKIDREKGLSIHELMNKYNLPKTTVWHHIHAIKLTKELEQTLRKRQGGSHNKYLVSIEKSVTVARELLEGKDREFIVAVSMLYWAEGHKKAFVFTNTDVKMLLLYQRFLYTILNIPPNNVSVLVRTSDPIIPYNAKKYWSKELALPLKSLTISHDNKQNKTRTTYGICRVMVAKSSFYLKVVKSLIELIQTEQLAPVVQRIELRTPNARI